jgi:serine/threonine protein phosphatase 1
MQNGRTLIIGDVHGCLEMLKRLVEKIDYRPGQDSLIFLGDYIDRGPEAMGVVEYILSLSRLSSGVHCLIGNHEAIFLDYLEGRDRRSFILNGGTTTLQSYHAARGAAVDQLVPDTHMNFYKSLKVYIELEDYLVVHAGFRPNLAIDKQPLMDMIWIRDPFISSDYDFGKRVIFGHTPFYEPFVMSNKIGLDTGAVYGNKLTCLDLPELRFHSVGP